METNGERKGIPLIGERMPSVGVQTTQGAKKIPEDYNGKWIVLFSHPGDFTPVCTRNMSCSIKIFGIGSPTGVLPLSNLCKRYGNKKDDRAR